MKTKANKIEHLDFGNAGAQPRAGWRQNLCNLTQTKPMKSKLAIVLIGLLGAVSPPLLRAQVTETYTFTTNRLVPDGNPAGLHDVRSVSSTIGTIGSVKVRLKLDGEFNGDLYGYLRHVQNGATNFSVLLNRPGRASTNSPGYADSGLDVTFQHGAANGDIHFYRNVTTPGAGLPLTGIWQPDGRTADPTNVTELSVRGTGLTNFSYGNASGEWSLYLADLESGGTNMLREWALEISGGAYPTLAWSQPAGITYGTALSGAQLNATATFNSTNVPGTFTYSYTNGTILNAGTGQTITVTFTPGDTSTFLAVSTNVTINVTPAALSIAANHQIKVYGAADPALTYTVSGLQASDTAGSVLTGALTRAPGENVGAYSITQGTLAANSNYTIAFTSNTLDVTPATFTVVADHKAKVYGAADPALTYVATGFQFSDTGATVLTGSLTRAPGQNVGTYAITQGTLVANSNYSIAFTGNMLDISAATLTVVADHKAKIYGAADPALTYVATGFQFSDTGATVLTGALTRASGEGVSTYAITQGTLAANPNYTIAFTGNTLDISAASLTVIADHKTKVYGSADPALTYVATGFKFADTAGTVLTGALTRAPGENVGTYAITQGTLAANTNYTIAFTGNTLDITQAGSAGSIVSSANPAPQGANVTFTMAVTSSGGTPTGSVNFRIDGSIAGSGALLGGIATYTTSSLSHGSHTVVAEYAGDLNFIGTSNTLSPDQVINSAPVAGADTIERYATQGVKVRLSTLLANDSDADNDTLNITVSSTSANGGTITVSGGWVFYTPASGFTNVDTFTYTITDGHGGSTVGTVTVNIKVDNEPGQNLSITSLGGDPQSYRIIGSGIPGRTYRLQFTDTLTPANWQDLPGASVTADSNGVFQFIDTSGSPTRYYRSVYP
jgi:hypothetical protein